MLWGRVADFGQIVLVNMLFNAVLSALFLAVYFGCATNFSGIVAYSFIGWIVSLAFQLVISGFIEAFEFRRPYLFWCAAIGISTIAAVIAAPIYWIFSDKDYIQLKGFGFVIFCVMGVISGLQQNIIWCILHLFIKAGRRAVMHERQAAAIREEMLSIDNRALSYTIDACFLPEALDRAEDAINKGKGNLATDSVLLMAEHLRCALEGQGAPGRLEIEKTQAGPPTSCFWSMDMSSDFKALEEKIARNIGRSFFVWSFAAWAVFFIALALVDGAIDKGFGHLMNYYFPQFILGIVLCIAMSWRISNKELPNISHRYLELLVFVAVGLFVSSFAFAISLAARGVTGPALWRCWLPSLEISYAVPMYLGLTAAFFLADANRREIVRLRATAEIREAALNARNAMLRQQLNPHFLFNALNALYTLILDRQFEQARAMIAAVKRFLDRASDPGHGELVALASELETQDAYLEIERARFGDRLQIERHVGPGLAEAKVPHLILQPLVENAVKYGVSRTDRPVAVEISAERAGAELVLQVRDSGAPEPAPRPPGLGLGLKNVEDRLRSLYGEAGRLACRRLDPTGFLAEVRMPLVM
jgi:hypothetical protein